MTDFFDYLRRERAASGHVAQELRSLIGVLGATVGQEEDGGFGVGGDEGADSVGTVADGELQRASRRDWRGARLRISHSSTPRSLQRRIPHIAKNAMCGAPDFPGCSRNSLFVLR